MRRVAAAARRSITHNRLAWIIMWDWLGAILAWLGFGSKSATIATVGLDNAGKSTLLHRLATGSLAELPPTTTAHSREFSAANVTFKAWDLGGHESWRKMWETFVLGAHAVLFLIDSVDADRLDEARDELDGIFDVVAEQVLRTSEAIPIAVLLNKRDLGDAIAVETLVERLGLDALAASTTDVLVHVVEAAAEGSGGAAPLALHRVPLDVRIFPCSVLRGSGYTEALAWLASRV